MNIADSHVSVDCSVFAFDGEKIKILLIKRNGEEEGEAFHDKKLPGSLIYLDENLDEAATRVLSELTGLKSVTINQFKAYGSKDRTSNPADVHWLERVQKLKIDRIITVAYIGLVRITPPMTKLLNAHDALWMDVNEVPLLAFDHNAIINDAIAHLRHICRLEPAYLFSLLPKEFTAAQFGTLYNLMRTNKLDVRNFHKKLSSMEFIVPTGKKEDGVAHRSAGYFRFDKRLYNKRRAY